MIAVYDVDHNPLLKRIGNNSSLCYTAAPFRGSNRKPDSYAIRPYIAALCGGIVEICAVDGFEPM